MFLLTFYNILLIELFVFLGVFDVLAYTDKDVAVPLTWVESDPKLIDNPQMVKLHSFDTKASLKYKFWYAFFRKMKTCNWPRVSFSSVMQIHKIDTLVSYKNDEWDEQ